ncbi:unnamed protein product, partial [Coregonus sp. 'balchen']
LSIRVHNPQPLGYHDNQTGEDLSAFSSYRYTITACSADGCVTSAETQIKTPSTAVDSPTMTSIRAHNITVSWTIPLIQNGEVTQYVLKANGEEVYRGRYCTPTPAQTLQPSAPSGVGPPTLQPLGPRQICNVELVVKVRVDWEPPARPNRVIVSYTVCQRDPALPSTHRFLYDPEHSAFSGRSTTLQELTSYHSATGQTMPLLELQRETRGLQTVFLLSWSPPAQPNGRVLHYEVYRRTGQNTEVRGRQQHWCVGMLPQRVVMPVSCPTLITNQYQVQRIK